MFRLQTDSEWFGDMLFLEGTDVEVRFGYGLGYLSERAVHWRDLPGQFIIYRFSSLGIIINGSYLCFREFGRPLMVFLGKFDFITLLQNRK